MAVRRTTREEREGDEIEVFVVRAGARAQKVTLESGATVLEAVEEAGFTVKDRDEVSVNGDPVPSGDLESYEVEDADRVQINPKFQGGH